MNATIGDIGAAIVWFGAVCVALAAIAVVIRFVVLNPLKHHLEKHFAPIQKEMKPNSGATVRDALDRIETMATDTQHQMVLMQKRFDDHLTACPPKRGLWG